MSSGIRPIHSENRALVASIAQRRRWLDECMTGPTAKPKASQFARGCIPHKVNMTVALAFLAPDLVKNAIDRRLPHGTGMALSLRPAGRMVSSTADARAQHNVSRTRPRG